MSPSTDLSPERMCVIASGFGVLGIEDTLERDRDGPLHRAGGRSRAVRYPQRAARPALSLGAGLPRRAGGARLPGAERRTLRQHGRDRTFPRSKQALLRRAACWRWRTPPVSVLGSPTEALRTGRHKTRRRRAEACLRNDLRRSCTTQGIPRRHDGHQPRREHGHRAKFPWKDHRTFVDVGTAQGDLAAQIALANPHLRGVGFDLPEVGPIFEEYVAKVGVADRLAFSRATSSRRPLPEGRRRDDGTYPARLGSADEEALLLRKAYDAQSQRAARSSSTKRSSTTTGRRTPSGC